MGLRSAGVEAALGFPVLFDTTLPALLAAACAGFLLADMLLVVLAGAAGVRRLYVRHEVLVLRFSGLVFLGFAAAALRNAATGLAPLLG